MLILPIGGVLGAPGPLVWGPPGPPETQSLGFSLELDFPPINLNEIFKQMWILALGAVLAAPGDLWGSKLRVPFYLIFPGPLKS